MALSNILIAASKSFLSFVMSSFDESRAAYVAYTMLSSLSSPLFFLELDLYICLCIDIYGLYPLQTLLLLRTKSHLDHFDIKGARHLYLRQQSVEFLAD